MQALETLSSPTILAVHADFLVCTKPAGLAFHQADAGAHDGFVDALRAVLRANPTQAAWADSLYPVHRLDRITSGLVLVARHADAARALGAQFEQGTIEKYYVALSARAPSKKQGWVKGAMQKGRNGAWRLLNPQDAKGAPDAQFAVTQFFSYGLGPVPQADGQALRLFVVRPRTGRTHQIRVALKSIGSPILGDALYGGGEAARGHLHAYSLRLHWAGEMLSFSAAPTGGLFDAPLVRDKLSQLGEPSALTWPAMKMTL